MNELFAIKTGVLIPCKYNPVLEPIIDTSLNVNSVSFFGVISEKRLLRFYKINKTLYFALLSTKNTNNQLKNRDVARK